MAAINVTINGQRQSIEAPPQMPLLWVLRDTLGLTGTKFGCGMGLCGACTVHIDGQAQRSCSTQISAVAGKTVTTIEGLSATGTHPVQQAWVEVDVPQCAETSVAAARTNRFEPPYTALLREAGDEYQSRPTQLP